MTRLIDAKFGQLTDRNFGQVMVIDDRHMRRVGPADITMSGEA